MPTSTGDVTAAVRAPETNTLRALFVEDSATDAKLIEHALSRVYDRLEVHRVEDSAGMRAALVRGGWDVVLCDWSMPRFAAPEAIALLRTMKVDVPLIIVSGTVGEASAVEAMRLGACDYVLKDNLTRLLPAVEREVQQRRRREAQSHIERTLRISEDRFERLSASGLIGIFEIEVGGRIVGANDAFLSMTGYAREDLEAGAIRWAGLMPEAWSHAPEDGELREVMRPVERELVGKNGARVTLLVGVAVLEHPTCVAFAADLTERKRAEETRARLAAIVESSSDAILSVDAEGKITSWNEGARALFGYDVAEAIDRPLAMLAPHDRAGGPLERIRRGEANVQAETHWTKKTGEQVEVAIAACRFRDASGRSEMSVVARDLTERRRAEGAMRRVEQRLYEWQKLESIGVLAAGLAHDFNNLLSVVMSNTTFALDQIAEGDPVRHDLEGVRMAATRASELTGQLLAFSRQETVQPRLVDVNELVTGMQRLLTPILGAEIPLTVSLQPGLGCVYADVPGLERVLLNLVVNAKDAMPGGGALRVETASVVLDQRFAAQQPNLVAGPYVMLRVSDTGSGMDAATQARAFEPFFTTKEKGRGAGLGLSTVLGLVQQSRGCIWIDSEPNNGTTVTVCLPQVPTLPEEKAEPPRPAVARGGETIVLVEEDDYVRDVARTILRRAGYHVLEASNGGEALLLFEEHGGRVDMLVAELLLPRLGGRQLAARLRAQRPDLKVLYMSRYATAPRDAQEREELAGAEILRKPITPAALVSRVREVLDAPPESARPRIGRGP